jgi:hypothetical protein
VRVTLLTGATCTPDRGRVVAIDSAAFLDWLGDAEKCPSVECADEPAKLAGAGFVFAQYVEGATAKANANLAPDSSTDLLCYDVDEATLDEVVHAAAIWQQVDSVIYSTWKHTAADPRVRFIVRLSRPVGNAAESDFRKVYATAAYLLQIPADPRASSRANFYFGPQHKPGRAGECERVRFRGDALDVDALLDVFESGVVPAGVVGESVDFEGVRAKPDKATVRALTKRLAAGGEREQWIGAALDGALRGERFAADGTVHAAMTQIAFELVRAVPLVDADWFAESYLYAAWDVMGGKRAHRLDDWRKAVSTAETKLAAGRADRAEKAAQYVPGIGPDMDAATLSKAAAVAGGLVCEHRGAYYVFDPRLGVYVGPLKGTGLAAACRRCLVGVPGFSYQSFRQNSPPVLKSGPKLVEEYGVDLESVHYHALPPAVVFDSERRRAHLPAYQWNEWPAVWHPIADELLRAMCGLSYGRVEAWLSRFRDLSQPLPALALIGSRGTWKSRTAQTLSRFWGPANDPTPCDASQVLNRFAGPLLSNPVIWSDEGLARSDSGRAIPEAYRRSITETAHAVERKGVDPVTLHTATRHIISVNDIDKVFGGEIDAASVEATVERYLVVQVDGAAIGAFEKRWAGTAEIARLRSGASLLEHVRWLETNTTHSAAGRLFVATDTNPELLLRARFADDTLSVCVGIAIDALLSETSTTVPGQIARLPLVCDERGRLRLSPGRIVDLWSDSKLTAGSALRKPTQQRVGRMLQKAGFKLSPNERAIDCYKWRAWAVEHGRLKEFLHVEGSHSWSDIRAACLRIFGREPVDEKG